MANVGRPADKRDLQQQIPVSFPRVHDRAIRRLARRKDVSIAEVVREAVAAYVGKG